MRIAKSNWRWEAFKARLFGNYSRAADLYYTAGEWKKAMQMYVRAGLYDHAARLAMSLGDYPYASRLFIKENDYASAGEAYEKMGRRDQAVECYIQARNPERAANLLEKSGLYERAANAWLKANRKDMAANAFIKGSMNDQAVPLLEMLLEEINRDYLTASDAFQRIRKYASFCAKFYLAQKKYLRAAQYFEQAGMWGDSARSYALAGEPHKAVRLYIDNRAYEKAAELIGTFPIAPGDAELYADTLYNVGEYERAAKIFRDAGLLFRAADCYEEIGEYEQSAQIYLEKDDPLRAADLFATAEKFEKAAQLYIKGGNFANAAQCFQRAGKNSEAASAFLKARKPIEAAKIYLSLGDISKAIEALQQVPPSAPVYKEAAFQLAKLFTKTGRYELSIEKFKETIGAESLSPQTIDKYYNLALCLEEMKQFAKAREIYTRILAAQIGFKDVEARLEALKTKEAERPPDADTITVDRKRVSATLSGRYEITDVVEDTLYKGWDSSLGRVVSIRKLDIRDLTLKSSDYQSRLREISALLHPNIVAFHDSVVRDNVLYLFLEYVSGVSLRQILNTRKTLPQATAIAIGTQIARAIEYAHSKDVVHGALKPENILVSSDNEVKVAGFAFGETSSQYAPPEVSAGSPPSKEVDLYQIALIVAEMLTGKLPDKKEAMSSNFFAPSVVNIIKKALSAEPKKRPRSAQEFLIAFSEAGLLPGVVISGRYEILEEIGAGGMSKVYKAFDRELGEDVVLKFLHRDLARDAGARERLLREVKMLRKISHPNVVRVHDIGRWNDSEFITMEYVVSENLFERVKNRGPFSVPSGVSVAVQICDGLEQAHRHRVIHRDIKPQNVVLTADGVPKLLDFGIARTHGGESDLTATGQLMGSPKYMAPEQILGKPLDVRSDIYSLGCVLYFMFSGREPFDADTVEAIAMKQIEKYPPRLTEAISDFPKWLDEIIFKALEKSPKERMPSAASFRNAMKEGFETFHGKS